MNTPATGSWMLYFGLALFVVALALLWQSRRQRARAGLPGGRVIYSDTRAWGKVEKPLVADDIGLVGKPDYLLQSGDVIIPVEVKSGRPPASPYDSHIFQLAAYCMLVHKHFGRRPPYGILHYSGRDFAIDYTAQLERALLDQLAEIRRDDGRRDVPRSHEEPGRCRKCGFRDVCDQRLA